MYVGKTKDVIRLSGAHFLGFRFKDNILGRAGVPDTGGNQIVGQEAGKGRMACDIACATFERLKEAGIPTHFVERLSEDSIMVRTTDPVRLEFISRRLAFGSYLRRHPGVAPLTDVSGTMEITLKDDAQDDPILSDEETLARGIMTEPELSAARDLLIGLTAVLSDFYKSRNLTMADFKMEVGRPKRPKKIADPADLLVIDELGYDNIRVFSGPRLLPIGELHAILIS